MKITSDMIADSIWISWDVAHKTGYKSEWERIAAMLQGMWFLSATGMVSSELLDDINLLQAISHKHAFYGI